jgi:tRNA dimethylallyltransferase
MAKQNVLVLVGPTAIGKTALSVELALYNNAEIISADSRQIYRYMDIGTAKPTADELNKVPHHFIDIVNPDEAYNAGQYGRDARKKIEQIITNGKNVIVTGGSGLYIKSLVDGFFEGTDSDDTVRQKIRSEILSSGLTNVYLRLQILDPDAASKIHPNDAKRIERALEVFELTGCRISELQRTQISDCPFNPVFAGLTGDRKILYDRIEKRVDGMMEQGVIEETRRLLDMGYSSNLISMESLGYREIIDYLSGSIQYNDMIKAFKQRSRNYAKRQITWFKKETRIRWFDVDENKNQELFQNSILNYYHSS